MSIIDERIADIEGDRQGELSDEERDKIMQGSLFAYQMNAFMQQFSEQDLFGGISGEQRPQVAEMMSFAAFHVSLAMRAYVINLVMGGNSEGPLMHRFIEDTDQMFRLTGTSLEKVLELGRKIAPNMQDPANQNYM